MIFYNTFRFTDPLDMRLSKLQEIVKDRERCAAVYGVAESDTT